MALATDPSLRSVRHVAAIRAKTGLGDLLCAVPALRSLRRGCPTARITLVGVPGAEWFVERFRWYVDDLLELPWWPGVCGTRGTAEATGDLLASKLPPFDLAVQLHGAGGPVNRLGVALGARRVIGHDPRPDRCTSRVALRAWPVGGVERDVLQDLVVWGGHPPTGRHLEFPELAGDADVAEGLLATAIGPVVVLHPGAPTRDRRWPAEGFAAIADRVAADGCTPVLVGGPDDRPAMRRVAALAECEPLLAPPMGLGSLAALVRRSSTLVVNDTGLAVLGAAVDTPTLVVATGPMSGHARLLDDGPHAVVRTCGSLPHDVGSVWWALDSLTGAGVR